MQPDIALVIGLVLAMFAIPSIISAFADSRAPRASAVIVLIAGALILYALRSHPGGYTMREIPEAFVRVIAQILN